MFNTKRIEALKEEINGLHSYINCLHARIGKIERKEIPNIIHCSTCKCLIRKEDAIRGKSEVRLKREVGEVFNTYTNSSKIVTVGQEEIIFTPYYCHSKDCKPKK